MKNETTYNDRGIAINGKGTCSFDNGFDGNVLIFDVDNRSSYYTNNRRRITF